MNRTAWDGKSILITGGTGSLGHALTAYLLEYAKPRKIVIVSRDEYKQGVMKSEFPDPRMRFRIGCVRDERRMREVCKDIDIVIHAAAMKQVPACEHDPREAVKTNIMGADSIIGAVNDSCVSRVIFISSDKAIEAVNLYGKTKAVAENMFISANFYKPIFSVTRWGNIWNSRGSVVPLFLDKRSRGESLPITDASMTRFVVNFAEAIATIERALTSQPGLIWCRKSPSMYMYDLMEAFGSCCESIDIRPGEKMNETLVGQYECSRAVDIGDYIVIKPAVSFDDDMVYALDGIPQKYAYASDTNKHFLTVDELKEMIANVAPRTA